MASPSEGWQQGKQRLAFSYPGCDPGRVDGQQVALPEGWQASGTPDPPARDIEKLLGTTSCCRDPISAR
jgi:hypothetical protein